MDEGLRTLERSVGFPVETTVDAGDRTIALFETDGASHTADSPPPAPGLQPNTNVCAVDRRGNVLWTVDAQISANSAARYTDLWTELRPPDDERVWIRHSDGRVERGCAATDAIWAVHTNGKAYQLDPSDGSIVETLRPGPNTVTVGGREHAFEYRVEESVRIDDLEVVRLGVPASSADNAGDPPPNARNVVALDEDGEQVWQIAALPSTNVSKQYRELWVEDGELYARHHVFDSVAIDTADGSVVAVSPSIKYNVLFVDETTAVVFPEGLDDVVDRGDHTLVRLAPDRWADDPRYEPGDELFDGPGSTTVDVVEHADVPADRNVVAVDERGRLRWTIECPTGSDPSAQFDALGTYLQVGDDVWARHDDGRVYRVDEESGTLVENVPDTRLCFEDRTVEFPYRVKQVLEFDEVVVVLLDTHSPSLPETALPDERGIPLDDRNVLGFDRDGTFRWAVSAVRPGNPYLNIYVDGDAIGFWNWGSCGGTIDPSTGEILDSHFAK